ncbi:hypothetical protein FRC02_004514 [Tulasnella sp. 418]|nr:hypothetical protein FRC02_004514 [Tulasnella sp. 418]
MTLAVNKMAIVRYVRRSLRNFMITLYNGVLGGSELLIGLSSRFEVGVSMTSYKWLMTGWTTVVSLLRLGSTKKGQDFAGGTITDNVNSDCVVWLLKKSQDAEILRKALEAVPSLPAGMLLERFKAQPNLLKRYVFMYISALQRHPGDIDFRLDDESTRDAIISGTALFHVLKSRLEVDRQDLMIEADIDPELRDALERDILHSQFDFSLKTVFHCIKTQTGEAKVFGWDLILLPTFLERFLVILQTRSHSAQSTNTSSPPPFVRSPSPITLLLDSLICLVAHISRHPPPNSHVELLVSTLDDTLLSLHKILQIHPKSMALTSHVALSVAHIQWLKRRCGSEVHSEKPAVDGIQLNHLRNAWLATDKRADGVSNIVLAFNLVGLKDSLATIDIYLDLLTLTDGLTPKAMDISWRLKDWEKWWFEIVQIIPGLLRLLRQIDLNERADIGHLAVRLLSRLIPDDWLFGDVTKELEKPENAGIRLISPFHPEYGSDMTALISSVVASLTSILDSLETRKNVAEVFCLMLAFPEVIRELPSLIENPGGMFQQSISIPALLISVIMDDKAENFELASRTAYVYNSMLKLPIQERPLIASFQFEALALGLANLRSGSNGLLLFYGVVEALNRLAPNEGFSWPTSFMKPRIRVARYEASPYKKARVEFVENEVRDYREQFGYTWRGEGLMILWRRLAAQNDFDPGRISYMFRQDVILTVLDCFDRSVPINYQISSDNMVDYLENALVWGGINDELKGRIDKQKDGRPSS